MSGVSLLPSKELEVEENVQEMVPNGDVAEENVPSRLSPIPIIDLGLFSSSDPSAKQEVELQKLQSALCSWGCFQAIGHGMSTSFLDKIRRAGKEFFEKPMEVKKKYSRRVEEFQGYGSDPTPEQGQSQPDLFERLFLKLYPEDQRKLSLWPESPSFFRCALEEYGSKMKALTEVISKAMAKSLNLEENCFLNQFGERVTLHARFSYYYSRCQAQRPETEPVLGLKPHCDGTGFSMILQDGVEGLQVLKDELWFEASTSVSDALLVLIGDQMEIMSNGVFKSPMHRVVANSDRERFSVTMFLTPQSNKEIGPELSLINDHRPKLFKNVINYGNTHWEYYQRGERAIHVAKV